MLDPAGIMIYTNMEGERMSCIGIKCGDKINLVMDLPGERTAEIELDPDQIPDPRQGIEIYYILAYRIYLGTIYPPVGDGRRTVIRLEIAGNGRLVITCPPRGGAAVSPYKAIINISKYLSMDKETQRKLLQWIKWKQKRKRLPWEGE